MKKKSVKKVAARKKKEKPAPEMLTEVPPVEAEALVDIPEPEAELLVDTPAVDEEALVDIPEDGDGELIAEADVEPPVEVVAPIYAPEPNPPVLIAPPRKARKVEKPKKGSSQEKTYTSAEIKKLRGEYSKRTLLTRFGIKL